MVINLVALILSLLLLQAGVGEASDGCPDDRNTNLIYYNTGNTTEGSAFQQKLKDVYQVLLDHAPLTGSSGTEFNHGPPSDRVYGFALCIKGNDCKGCLQLAKRNFESVAPLSKGGSLCLKTSTDVCYLRYETYSFRFNCLQGLSP